MLLFVSEYTNKVDNQGRVSVPASFRTQLDKGGFETFFAFPHQGLPCLEAWDPVRLERLALGMDTHIPMSTHHTAKGTIISKSKELTFDPEGRVKLTGPLLTHASIKDRAVFAGRGVSFQIWEPGLFDAYEEQGAALVRANPDTMMPGPDPRLGGGNG